MGFQNTTLWKEAFDKRDNDPYADERELLRLQIINMRDKVSQLVSHIPADCKNLTVHDVTHLDALWESSQEICGDRWQLNPAEAFVLGAAFLTHDAALTTLAYPGGRDGLKKTALWEDIFAERGSSSSEDSILFEVLRNLHAQQAASLCTRSWTIPGGDQVFLIENSELRLAYGEIIGRVAHSHHWNADRLLADLVTHVGGSHTLPREWTINECKLGCLIRCADAAQIDRTRAPIMLYAALGPEGYSRLHWTAQNKLNRPILRNDAILLSSSSTFTEAEADSWWVAYDLAKVLDQELRASNAILTDIGVNTFAAQRVAGAESPAAFSKNVRTVKWRPIDASVRVSDPLKIARTLGGRNLYGRSNTVPFRELIQNSTDAIRARRALEQEGRELGCIKISVENHQTDGSKCLVFIDDNGIGMSERILSTTLVDFGRSFWNSGILQEEFPGLSAAKVRHIGKFGIGFFSIFELSQHVKVASRRYDAALDDVKVLDFRGLVNRPLLREGSRNDIPSGFNTRVTLEISKSITSNVSSNTVDPNAFDSHRYYASPRHMNISPITLKDALKGICAFLDVRFEFSDRRNGEKFTHTADIYEKPASELISELPIPRTLEVCKYFDSAKSMSPIVHSSGDSFGRAALDVDMLLEGRSINRGFYSIGGVISHSANKSLTSSKGVNIPFYGVVEGQTERAARDVSTVLAPQDAIDTWLINQLNNINTSVLRKSEVMTVASFSLLASGKYSELPLALHAGKFKSAQELYTSVKQLEKIYIPVSWKYETWPETMGYNSLRPEFFEANLSENIVVLGSNSERLFEEDDAKEIRKDQGGEMDRETFISKWDQGRAFVTIVERAWQKECAFRISKAEIFTTSIASLIGERWVVVIEKSFSKVT